MDQGGKKSGNPAIVSLFDKYGSEVRWTAPETSHQNYPVKALIDTQEKQSYP